MEGMSKQIKLMMMHARTTARFTHVLHAFPAHRLVYLRAGLQFCNNEQTDTGLRMRRLSAQLATLAAATVYGTHVSYGVLMSVRAFIASPGLVHWPDGRQTCPSLFKAPSEMLPPFPAPSRPPNSGATSSSTRRRCCCCHLLSAPPAETSRTLAPGARMMTILSLYLSAAEEAAATGKADVATRVAMLVVARRAEGPSRQVTFWQAYDILYPGKG